jgi:hypothetical protein
MTDAGEPTGTDDTADRFARVATTFSEVVDAVPDDAWDRPAPCEGWVARDVVDHLVTWVPSVLGPADLGFVDTSAEPDPASRWHTFAATISDALADPVVARREFDAGPPGTMTVEAAIAMLVVGACWCTAGTWPSPRASRSSWTRPWCTTCSSACSRWTRCCVRAALRAEGPAARGVRRGDQLLAFTGRDVARWV